MDPRGAFAILGFSPEIGNQRAFLDSDTGTNHRGARSEGERGEEDERDAWGRWRRVSIALISASAMSQIRKTRIVEQSVNIAHPIDRCPKLGRDRLGRPRWEAHAALGTRLPLRKPRSPESRPGATGPCPPRFWPPIFGYNRPTPDSPTQRVRTLPERIARRPGTLCSSLPGRVGRTGCSDEQALGCLLCEHSLRSSTRVDLQPNVWRGTGSASGPAPTRSASSRGRL